MFINEGDIMRGQELFHENPVEYDFPGIVSDVQDATVTGEALAQVRSIVDGKGGMQNPLHFARDIHFHPNPKINHVAGGGNPNGREQTIF